MGYKDKEIESLQIKVKEWENLYTLDKKKELDRRIEEYLE